MGRSETFLVVESRYKSLSFAQVISRRSFSMPRRWTPGSNRKASRQRPGSNVWWTPKLCGKKQVQAATIAQERPHAEQRYEGNLESRVPQSFARQSANMVRTHVKRLWVERGGRDLSIAEGGLRNDYKTAMRERVIIKRPNQCGDPFFFWLKLQPQYQQVALTTLFN